MARRTRVTTWYARQFGRVIKTGSERSLAVARIVQALTAAEELPGPSEFEAAHKPVGRAWVRRVGGRNLWLWYRFDENEVMLVALTTEIGTSLARCARGRVKLGAVDAGKMR